MKNTELNGRLIKYKRKERALSERFAGVSLDESNQLEEYKSEAQAVGEAWIELVVDMASMYGDFLEREYVEELKLTIRESIADSTAI